MRRKNRSKNIFNNDDIDCYIITDGYYNYKAFNGNNKLFNGNNKNNCGLTNTELLSCIRYFGGCCYGGVSNCYSSPYVSRMYGKNIAVIKTGN